MSSKILYFAYLGKVIPEQDY